ncbi:MAG: hypothetical protein ACLUNZ_00225 [Evtepia sp.]
MEHEVFDTTPTGHDTSLPDAGLALTACGGQSEPSPAEGSSSLAGALVGGKRSMVSESAQTTDPEKGAAALALLRESMAGEDQLAGAVAYLGHREQAGGPAADELAGKNFS